MGKIVVGELIECNFLEGKFDELKLIVKKNRRGKIHEGKYLKEKVVDGNFIE